MATLIHLDTHAAAWLFMGRTDLFPARVRARLERDDLVVSPMVVLELQYLHEVGKTTEPGDAVIAALRRILLVTVCDRPFEAIITAALRVTWTRDPFDRIITTQADLAEADLVTKDRNIHRHYPRALWD